MRIYQQVLDVGADTAKQLSQLLGASPEDALVQLSGRAHWASSGEGPDFSPNGAFSSPAMAVDCVRLAWIQTL